ncbi:MAG: hypothetical protein ACPLRR_06465 [Candidatus Saccharicenans sp.]
MQRAILSSSLKYPGPLKSWDMVGIDSILAITILNKLAAWLSGRSDRKIRSQLKEVGFLKSGRPGKVNTGEAVTGVSLETMVGIGRVA